MISTTLDKQALIEFDIAARPLAGQEVSGDLHLVKPFDNGVLLAAIDGVGHGREAAAAARGAASILENHAHESVTSLVIRCHEALTRTRGVVMTIASLNVPENTLAWLGVGNVKGLLVRADANASRPFERVLLRSGLVGYQLPALHESVMLVTPGDLLIFATDGVCPGFANDVDLNGAPRQLAARILQRHSKNTDDALVLVARYLGMPHE